MSTSTTTTKTTTAVSATSARTSDCRKFSPNIFNKSKCSHCFRQREEHSAAALECNRASRKVSKCGYLFVAPDWDFSNPLYRTKRWQRRWFVLYDDGEFTYSVDDYPDTVPQACIDMTKVIDVTTAEEVTGHTNSIAITSSERVTFVKGTSPDESHWWLNILTAFPKTKGRHKRSATLPGGQSSMVQVINSDSGNSAIVSNRHSSYHKDTLTSSQSTSSLLIEVSIDGNQTAAASTSTSTSAMEADLRADEEDDGVETGEDADDDDEVASENSSVAGNKGSILSTSCIRGQDENNRNAGNEITNRVSQPTSCLLIENIRRDEKTIKDIANTITNLSQQQNKRWSTAVNNVLNNQHNYQHHHQHDLGQYQSSRDETDFQVSGSKSNFIQQPQSVNLRPKSLPLALNSTPAIVSAIVKKIPTVMVSQKQQQQQAAGTLAEASNSITANKCKSSPRLQLQLKHLQQQQRHHQQQQQHYQHERGDPDGGCNLDDLSSNYLAKTAELRATAVANASIDSGNTSGTSTTKSKSTSKELLSATTSKLIVVEESLNAKKGWLMKQDNRTGDWSKHWFTLSGAALFYYRDPISEERGVLDGVLDVNSLTNVIVELNASKQYAFQLITWDKQRLLLASLSPNSRNSWVAVLRSAAGLPQQQQQVEIPASEAHPKSDIEKDFIKAQLEEKLQSKLTTLPMTAPLRPQKGTASVHSPLTPTTPRIPLTGPHFSSEDEEYRTASEGGRRDSIDWGSPLSPSPPMPPLAAPSLLRTNKERCVRTRTVATNCPRLHKRSRSSPPSSRRSTVDSVGSDELPPALQLRIHTVQEEHNIDKELKFRLSSAEQECDSLRSEAKAREARMSELLTTLERTEQQLNARIHEMEMVREQLNTELLTAKQKAADIVDSLSLELEESQSKIKQLEDRLAQGIDENETLYKRLRELEAGSNSPVVSFSNLNRHKMKRMDSLSDLTTISDIDPYCLERNSLAEEYNELRTRFEKAINEIKAMKRELKESQNQFDSLEISYAALKQDLERKELEDRAQLQLMAARIQDLTLKYSSSERQVRALKQKLAKSERRRSLSLKGKEQLSVSKELELKVIEMETKFDHIEKECGGIGDKVGAHTCTDTKCCKKSTRRRSLDCSPLATTSTESSLHFTVRVNDLEKRFENISAHSTPPSTNSSTPTNESAVQPHPRLTDHLIERLRSLEHVLLVSKDRLEQSLHQLQVLRTQRARRSVSPIMDRKDSYRNVERALGEIVMLIRESCDTCVVSGVPTASSPPLNDVLLTEPSPVKLALTQLESQLRNKLADLLNQRRVLRERNELTKRKNLELLAERVAYESVCFGRLCDSVARAEQPERFGTRQTCAEVAETAHMMTMLKAKLSGKCPLKASCTVDILAGVLARRLVHSASASNTTVNKSAMEPVDPNMLVELLRQQTEINVILKRYKHHTMDNLATGLAAETLSYMAANDLVQGAVQEAWRQAQETVNSELVQTEIAHIMIRNAERFELATTPAFGYALTAQERLSFERFADAVHDTLRKEMEQAVSQLTHCYELALQQLKRGQWQLHLELQDRKASEGRQLLAEFADIVAHKALIDARIAVLRGKYKPNSSDRASVSGGTNSSKVGCPIESMSESPAHTPLNVLALQKYEQLFEELSSDLQLEQTAAADIVTQADYEFMFKQHTVNFLSDRQVLAEISIFLGQLEDSLIGLQCEATAAEDATSSISRTAIEIDCLQDVCRKCCELRQRADQLQQQVHLKLSTPCAHCLQRSGKLCTLEGEIARQQQAHSNEHNKLVQLLEQQRTTLKQMETTQEALSSDLNQSEEIIEERECELSMVQDKLKAREKELDMQQSLRAELLQRCDIALEASRGYQEESDALIMKCARQDEQYALLLQERDNLGGELGKEQERCKRFEKRLELLEREHGKQLECLQEALREQLLTHGTELTNVAEEESFRQRYQKEIEQLKTLCEKGLNAMESSHRRIISNLEEKHNVEIERLLAEKETALAEETQATLAALDAMRKAHQSEVQREVARFKQDFLRQVQRGEHTLGDNTKLKEEELEELRQEIFSFSEKYSIKCVENAALEQKLRVTNSKLRNFQQIQQLELRSKQFRAHLASDNPASDANFVQGLTTGSKDDAACQDSEV